VPGDWDARRHRAWSIEHGERGYVVGGLRSAALEVGGIRKIANCEFEVDQVLVFRFQLLCLFFLTPETSILTTDY
jgi:hypothetical protein